MGRLLLSAVIAAMGLLCGAGSARAEFAGTPLWTNIYGPAETYDLAVDSGGNVFVAGRTGGATADFLTIKYSGTGVPLWTNIYNGPANVGDQIMAVAVDGNGNAFVTGFSSGNGCTTIKYSATGLPLWTNHLDASNTTAIAVDASGKVFVAGSSSGDYITVAYSNTGVPLWTNRYNGPINSVDEIQALVVDGSGNVVVTGYSYSGGGVATIKYSNAGIPLWTNRDDSVGFPHNLRVDGSGNVFVIGDVIVKHSAAGATLWISAPPAQNGIQAAALDSSGNLYVAGSSSNPPSANYDFLTIKYSGAGVPLWTNRFNGPLNINDYPSSIVVDGSGNAFVHGDSAEPIGGGESFFRSWITVAYSSAGVPLWTNNYAQTNGGASWAGATAVDASDNVFVAGASVAASDPDSVTVKYSSAVLPRLAISRMPGNAVELSWPSPSLGFTLQVNTNADRLVNWSNVSATVQDDGLRKRMAIDAATGNRFYRLSRP